MIGFKIFGIFRISEGGKSPKTGREPGVQSVGVLLPTLRSLGGGGQILRLIRSFADGNFLIFIPNRNPVSIPDLPRNTPVAKVVYPVIINFLKSFRNYFYLSALHRFFHYFLERGFGACGDAIDL